MCSRSVQTVQAKVTRFGPDHGNVSIGRRAPSIAGLKSSVSLGWNTVRFQDMCSECRRRVASSAAIVKSATTKATATTKASSLSE